MIVLTITVLLAATGIAVMPCWRYSAGWGYGPGTCIGLLLVGIGISAVLGRGGAADALGERLAMPAKPGFVIEASVIKASAIKTSVGDPIQSTAIAAPAIAAPD